eukprot:GHRQ01000756.1.p2 GENE.GHRQ01000756.1~~GHRQ01000756.1.p2  ORF type:complete len:251 (+),score=75.81 GHRQ01000756.1:105-755(+)
MAVTMRRACVGGVASRSRTVRVCAAKQDAPRLQSIAAGVAAAVLLSVAPAKAGVILEQPKYKKVLQDNTPALPAVKREIILPGQRKNAPAASVAAPKVKATPKAAETSGGDLDPKAVALPGTLALIAGGAFALSKVDEGFGDFMTEASCKDNNADGAGYETALKGAGGPALGKTGTKRVKAASKAASKTANKVVNKAASKAGTAVQNNPLASFFDK